MKIQIQNTKIAIKSERAKNQEIKESEKEISKSNCCGDCTNNGNCNKLKFENIIIKHSIANKISKDETF